MLKIEYLSQFYFNILICQYLMRCLRKRCLETIQTPCTTFTIWKCAGLVGRMLQPISFEQHKSTSAHPWRVRACTIFTLRAPIFSLQNEHAHMSSKKSHPHMHAERPPDSRIIIMVAGRAWPAVRITWQHFSFASVCSLPICPQVCEIRCTRTIV